MTWQRVIIRRLMGIRQQFVAPESGRRVATRPAVFPRRRHRSLPVRPALYADLDRRRRHAQIAARKLLADGGAC